MSNWLVVWGQRMWSLTGNRLFSVKSFYDFLIDGGLRCQVVKFFQRNWCPKKSTSSTGLLGKTKFSHQKIQRAVGAIGCRPILVSCATRGQNPLTIFSFSVSLLNKCGIISSDSSNFHLHPPPYSAFEGHGDWVCILPKGFLGTQL